MKQKDKEDFENKNICRFCEKEIKFEKVRDHCLENTEDLLITSVI